MEARKINNDYRKVAERLISKKPELAYIKDSSVKVIYLESDAAKKADKDKVILGECERVQSKNQWAIDADFTITVYTPNIIGMSRKQIEILLFHELLHIGIDWNDNGECFYVRKHDLEDFKIIIDKYGTDWAKVTTD